MIVSGEYVECGGCYVMLCNVMLCNALLIATMMICVCDVCVKRKRENHHFANLLNGNFKMNKMKKKWALAMRLLEESLFDLR